MLDSSRVRGSNWDSPYRWTAEASIILGQMVKQSMPYKHLVIACFDESGKLHDSKLVVFGGCVLHLHNQMEFSQAWEKRLRDDGLAFTSMKEAVHLNGPYRKWKTAPGKRDSVIEDLARLIDGFDLFRIVSLIDTAEFKSLDTGVKKKLGGDPQYAAFEACVLGILHSRLDIGVQVICDLSEEYSEKCVRMFHKLRRNNPDAKDRVVGLAFSDDEVHAGLQAADMIAYCVRADRLKMVKPLEPIVERVLEILKTEDTTDHSVLYHINGGGLGYGEVEHQAGV